MARDEPFRQINSDMRGNSHPIILWYGSRRLG